MSITKRLGMLGRVVVPSVALAVAATGCATHKFVRAQDETARFEVGQQIDQVSGQVEQLQDEVERLETDVAGQGAEISELSATAQEALDRALAAGKLAEGKFLYETVLSDDGVKFGLEEADLSEEARGALDEFATQIKEQNQDVYIEIQGHTDSTGDESYNLVLGQERAESVRRYLSLEHGFALHRTAVISYGETAPLVDNSTREGRMRNRRVSLVVLR